ncbi:helix-hairpin-helix domain-containing protein [Pseudomonas capeferrum]|uniref:ComEA family DNA-binding protein n=1 Tax=Pseudomonas capeferrum TaxID=1495066 RepID=UPI0015E35F91|nr:helix-hairpin-helix domain-containing protein [Pseudomonas capeferrum]MBA1204417.1 helix-hairpin-helix domain-containing protein [Pseudomonas capeferrum]
MRNMFLSNVVLPLFTSLALSMSAAHAAEPMGGQGHAQATAASAMNKDTATAPMMATPMVGQGQEEQLDLNKADAATLQSRLNGIGKAKAEAIVAYREAHGPFATVDELLEIKGIGKALLERNRDKLKVE